MKPKVLVVDDSLTARKLLVQHLQKFQVLEASDGVNALELTEKNTDIKIIFIDLNMPWMDGLEFIAKVRNSEILSNIPICILTGEMGHKSLEKAKQFGVNAFIIKPVNKEQIESVTHSLLG